MEVEDLEEHEIDLETADDDAIQVDNYLDESILEEDLEYEIPKVSRILFYHGNSQSENDWMCQQVKNDIKLDYYSKAHFKAIAESYKYMSAKIPESNKALNKYLDEFVDEVKARCQQLCESELKDEEFRTIVNELAEEEAFKTRFRVKTAVETYYIGRIRYSYVGGKLSSRNIYLEGSVTYCQGDVVPLDLSLFVGKSQVATEESPQAHLMSLFPGQVVVIKAQNPTGKSLRVTRFVELSELFEASFPNKCPKVLLKKEPVNIVCASGPSICLDASKDVDLTDTTYMRSLAGYVRKYNPEVLFIFGPFFDETHSDLIAQWSLKASLSDSTNVPYQWSLERLFNHQFSALSKELEGLKLYTKIIYIPSPNEFGSANIFPTFPKEIKQIVPIQSFSNPCIFNLGGIAIGATSTDVLMHMSRNEVSNIPKGSNLVSDKKSDRLKRLSSHMLEHMNFYPLLPADRTVNLECSMYKYLRMHVTPHLLILPSILRPFVYNVDDTIVINPGKLNKNSIARIKIDPVKDASSYRGSISEYVNVEIIKLIFDDKMV